MKRIRIKHFAHVCMLAFAGASLFNLKAYLIAVDGNPALAWCLAVALSGVLVILAGLLSELQWNIKDAKFLTVLSVTAGLAIVSGSIQGASYAMHGNWLSGYALGYALPGLGELGLALAISAYTRSLDGREVAEAQRQLAMGVRRHLVEAIANVDKSRIEVQVNKAMATITRELVDSVVSDMVGELRSNRRQITSDDNSSLPVEVAFLQNEKSEISENTVILHDSVSQIAKMNEGKQAKIANRRDEILHIISKEELSINELAQRTDCSPRTIRNDLESLQSAGHSMSINGVVKLAT